MEREASERFATEWKAALPFVCRLCRYHLGDLDIDDVIQDIALRAWQSFPRLRDGNRFQAWIHQITRNRIRDEWYRRMKLANREADQLTEDAPEKPLTKQTPELKGVAEILAKAKDSSVLSEREWQLIRTRLSNPAMTWSEIATIHELNASTCAAIHCRAIPKLRAYLLSNHPSLLGGAAVLNQAFQRAVASPRDALTPAERVVFEERVLRKRLDFCPLGWRSNLRTACSKVAQNISFGQSNQDDL